MEKNNNKKETTVTLNDKGILLIGFIVIALTFALGFVVSSKGRGKDVTVFTRSDLERIERCQEMEDSDVYAYKDKDGNLMIGWKRSDSDD